MSLPVETDTTEKAGSTESTSSHDLTVAQDRISNLENALVSSRIIGIAIGIVMERHKLESADAFHLLVQASQRANLKVRDLAEQLVYTGEIRR